VVVICQFCSGPVKRKDYVYTCGDCKRSFIKIKTTLDGDRVAFTPETKKKPIVIMISGHGRET